MASSRSRQNNGPQSPLMGPGVLTSPNGLLFTEPPAVAYEAGSGAPKPFAFHVYDLSQGIARTFSPLLLPPDPVTGKRGIDAILHSAVVAFGYEYFFEGGVARRPAGRTRFGPDYAVVGCAPRHVTRRTRAEFERWIKQCDWDGGSLDRLTGRSFGLLDYRAISHNCHAFCDAAARFLTEGREGAPSAVMCNLPRMLDGCAAAAITARIMERLAGGVVHMMKGQAKRAIGHTEVAFAAVARAQEASHVQCVPPAAFFVPRPWRERSSSNNASIQHGRTSSMGSAASRSATPTPGTSGIDRNAATVSPVPLNAGASVWRTLGPFVRAVVMDRQAKLREAHRAALQPPPRLPPVHAVVLRIEELVSAVVGAPSSTDVPPNAATILCDALTVALAHVDAPDPAEESMDSCAPQAPGTPSPDSGEIPPRKRDSLLSIPARRSSQLSPRPQKRVSNRALQPGSSNMLPANAIDPDEDLEPFEDAEADAANLSAAPSFADPSRRDPDVPQRPVASRLPGSCVDGPAAEAVVREFAAQRHGIGCEFLLPVLRSWATLALNPHVAIAIAQHASLLNVLEELLDVTTVALWPPEVLAALLDLVAALSSQHVGGSFLKQRMAQEAASLVAVGLFARDWAIIDRAAGLFNNLVLLHRSFTVTSIDTEMDRHGTAIPLGRAAFAALGALRCTFPAAQLLVQHPRLFLRPNPLSSASQVVEARSRPAPNSHVVGALTTREQSALTKLLLGLLHFAADGDNPASIVVDTGLAIAIDSLGEQCMAEEAHQLRRIITHMLFPQRVAGDNGGSSETGDGAPPVPQREASTSSSTNGRRGSVTETQET